MKVYLQTWFDQVKLLWSTRSLEIRSLNGLRAISALALFGFHTNDGLIANIPQWPTVWEFWGINLFHFVDLFFVLSGFLIYGHLAQQFQKTRRLDFMSYFRNRALRILPAYFVYVGIGFLFFWMRLHQMEAQLQTLPARQAELEMMRAGMIRFLFDFLYLSDYYLSVNPHTWSLAIEFQFYILLPLIAPFLLRLSPKKRITILGLIYLLPLVFRFWHLHVGSIQMPFWPEYSYGSPHATDLRHQAYGQIYHFFHTRMDALIMGLLVYELASSSIMKSLNQSRGRFTLLLLLALGLFGVVHSGLFDTAVWLRSTLKYNAYSVSFGLFVLLALHSESWWSRFWSAAIWTPLARLSYSFYLWNLLGARLTIDWLVKIGHGTALVELEDYLIAYAGGTLITLILALLMYLFIETPFLALKKKRQKELSPKVV